MPGKRRPAPLPEFPGQPSPGRRLSGRQRRPPGKAVLNPASPWGILDRPSRRAPYTSGCFLPRGGLLALGGRHGHARLSGALFAAAHLPALPLLGPVLETAGTLTPRFGAFQVLAVGTGTPGQAV